MLGMTVLFPVLFVLTGNRTNTGLYRDDLCILKNELACCLLYV